MHAELYKILIAFCRGEKYLYDARYIMRPAFFDCFSLVETKELDSLRGFDIGIYLIKY